MSACFYWKILQNFTYSFKSRLFRFYPINVVVLIFKIKTWRICFSCWSSDLICVDRVGYDSKMLLSLLIVNHFLWNELGFLVVKLSLWGWFIIGVDIGRTRTVFGWKIPIRVDRRARKFNPSPSIQCPRFDRFGLCGLSDASGELNWYIEIPIQKNTKNNKYEELLMIKVPWSEKDILEKETNW